MISSKRITLISLSLLIIVLFFTVLCLFMPQLFNIDKASDLIHKYSSLHSLAFSGEDFYTDYSKLSYKEIKLNNENSVSYSKDTEISGQTVTVRGAGAYLLSGKLSDGSIIVDSAQKGTVHLILNGVDITSKDFAAIYVKQAGKVIISTVKSTQNTLTDGEEYSSEKLNGESITAALYSKDNLTINGEGSLLVNANYLDAIKCNDTLKITGGTLDINSKDDAINANDAIGVENATINITSQGDSIKCENENTSLGFIALTKTNLQLTSSGDGIASSSAVYLRNTCASITTGGGSGEVLTSQGFQGWGSKQQAAEDIPSTKALKASLDLNIEGGEYTLNSSDDAIHSDGDMTIKDAVIKIESSDDALHAEKNLFLSPSSITVTKSLEGIEGGYITIDGGDITVISSDDGINAVGENSNGAFMPPMATPKENLADEDIYLTINGGNLLIEAGGDGVDTNGAAVINGGSVIVYGPENNGNSSLDFQYGFVINGGKVFAAGSAGMAETPTELSKQNSIAFYLEESFEANTDVKLINEDGEEIFIALPTKKFDYVCISTEKIKEGKSYTLIVNGNEAATASVTSKITTSGDRRGRMMMR